MTLSTHHIHALPVLVLMPHSRCNCRCVMCDIWQANQDKQEISSETLSAHIGDLRKLNVRWVVLSGGEAMMHSNLWRLCELLKACRIKISLLSTGLLLEKHAEEIIRWCDEVIVSLDGRREVHDAIRNVPNAFEKLATGVRALKNLDSGFPVSARCVVQRGNYADLPNIIDAAHEMGLQQVSFLAADVSTTAFNRPQPWGDERISDIALSPREVHKFHDILEKTIIDYAADFETGFIAESPDKMRRLARYFDALNGSSPFPKTVCNAPWISSVIEADGSVRPCFFHQAFGNIHDQSLLEILNSEEAVQFRRDLDVKEDPICQKCVCTLHLSARDPLPFGLS